MFLNTNKKQALLRRNPSENLVVSTEFTAMQIIELRATFSYTMASYYKIKKKVAEAMFVSISKEMKLMFTFDKFNVFYLSF